MDTIKDFPDKCMIIKIRKDSPYIRGCSLYEAIRRCWNTVIEKARRADYVLAVIEDDPKVVGVFKPTEWYYLAEEFCKEIEEEECKNKYGVNIELCRENRSKGFGRIAFNGVEIKDDEKYLNKRIPFTFIKGGDHFRYTF